MAPRGFKSTIMKFKFAYWDMFQSPARETDGSPHNGGAEMSKFIMIKMCSLIISIIIDIIKLYILIWEHRRSYNTSELQKV